MCYKLFKQKNKKNAYTTQQHQLPIHIMGCTADVVGHHTIPVSKIYPSMQWAQQPRQASSKLHQRSDTYRQTDTLTITFNYCAVQTLIHLTGISQIFMLFVSFSYEEKPNFHVNVSWQRRSQTCVEGSVMVTQATTYARRFVYPLRQYRF